MLDFGVIRNYYSQMPVKIEQARNILKRSMTLTEKILFSHLFKIEKEWVIFMNLYLKLILMILNGIFLF